MSRIALQVPVDARFQQLGAELAGKYAELLSGASADAESFAQTVERAIASLVEGESADSVIELTFGQSASSVEVTIVCHGRTTTVTHPLPARKR